MTKTAQLHGSPARAHGLDALRGLAATGVVITHAIYIHPLGVDFSNWNANYFSMGVPLFFIISAMSMSLAYPGGIGSNNAARYGLRRYFRIAPLFYIVLAAWLYLGVQTDMSIVLQNLTFTFGFFRENQISLVPAGWSVGVEMIFYLLFPLLCIFRGITRALLILTVAFTAAYTVNHLIEGPQPNYFYWTQFATNAPYFAFGLLAYEIYRAVPEHLTRVSGLAALFCGLLILTLMVIYGPVLTLEVVSIEPVPMVLIAGWGSGFALLVLSQALHPVGSIVNSVTLYLGKISYSLYLMHPFFIYVSLITPWAATLSSNRDLVVPIVALVVLACVIPIAALLYYVVEEPFIKLGRRLTVRHQRQRT